MKKHYLTLRAFVFLFVAISFKLSAQLSGNITIDSSQPTSGAIYQTFSAFAASLNAVGVSGPLTVNVSAGSGPYIEQVNFTQAPGISSTNTITINGNGCIITYNGTVAATAWTMLLSGADYMTVNNLTVIGTGTAQALACHLWSGADNNYFNNCTFSVSTTNTGTNLSPFSISGTSVSPTATGLSGNNNIVSTCTMTGGYYNTVFQGQTTSPFNSGNQLYNSLLREFYLYGFYNGYNVNAIARGNIVERPTRASISTGYGIYLNTGSSNALIEKNHVRSLAGANFTTTSSMYAIYLVADASLNNENKVRNNLVTNIRSNGVQAAVYMSGPSYALVDHNTLVLDDVTSTAGTTYGVYCSGPNNKIRNNVVYITRAGTGTKYSVYLTAAATPLVCNHNDLFLNSPAGTNNVGYLATAFVTLANWQAGSGYDMNSSIDDPQFTNVSMGNYIPTAQSINNLCLGVGVSDDYNNVSRSPTWPDPGAFEIFNAPCNSAPAANSFVTPTISLCPGTIQDFNLASTSNYTNSGFAIQWYESISTAFGPFTAGANGTLSAFTTAPINQTTYYVAVITCTNGQASYTTAAGMVQVAPTTTNTVPYYEGFESLALNELPNCSWSATGIGGATNTYTSVNTNYRVPRTGNNYAAFSNTPSGINYFYSNGVWLNPGITYSAAIWFIQETANVNNWSDLSIHVGTTQTSGSMTQIVSTNGTLTPSLYTLLSNTFTIPSAGLYYMGVRGVAGPGVPAYLTWDDLSVTIPCSHNAPPLQLGVGASTICMNQTVTINAAGANSYSWSTGQTLSSIAVSPTVTTSYAVTGTNTLSGCSITLAQQVVVKPTPQVFAFANTTMICPGNSANLSAQGANSYTWSTGDMGSTAVVTPTASHTYSVMGSNTLMCSSMATVQVMVGSQPAVSASATSTLFCNGQDITFSGTGAQTYEWLTGPNSIVLGNNVVLSPGASATYTLIGTNADGCEGISYLSFGVEECTSIREQSSGSNLFKAYPNPTMGELTLEISGSGTAEMELSDVTGRVILADSFNPGVSTINISNVANGVYYLKVKTQTTSEIIKVVKH